MSSPRVSVLMPARNAERYVASAIESVLRQSLREFEVVVCDDGSTDGTWNVLEGFRDPRVRRLRNEENRGLVATRNRLVEEASGQFLAPLDADDLASRRRLEIQARFLERRPHLALVGALARTIDDGGDDLGELMFDHPKGIPPRELPGAMLFRNCLVNSVTMFRRARLPAPVYRSGLAPSEDYDLWARMLGGDEGALLPRVLGSYRRHPASASRVEPQHQLRSSARVRRESLERLGVAHSAEDLELHLALAKWDFPREQRTLARAGDWLARLGAANRVRPVIPEPEFSRQLGLRWAFICLACVGVVPDVWGAFTSSPVSRGVPLWTRARFALYARTRRAARTHARGA